ncbi:MAG: hypothetical protein IJU72_02845 [Bacteroidales bacterium]|nr:hypothetical protein [Bacteroidales bacterium]
MDNLYPDSERAETNNLTIGTDALAEELSDKLRLLEQLTPPMPEIGLQRLMALL